MWTISEVKEEGKTILNTCFWPSVAVSFICSIFTGGSNIGSNSGLRSSKDDGSSLSGLQNSIHDLDINPAAIIAIVATVIGVLLIAVIISIAFKVFVSNIIEVGTNSYFLEARKDSASPISLIFSMFKSGRYKNVCFSVFMKNLFVGLWSLLFFIPGIIKSYEYFMVEYILAENPNMDYKRALEISSLTTEGEKWQLFLLSLSFIGWILLSVLSCLILWVVYVNPYINHTMAGAYLRLKEKAINSGIASAEEFVG